ncbi:hypothetical protein H2O64_04540 [Kordia sp. YSTF-M3]|uniref:Uncharacterized protein n=1 Tax=Kordia aestuariivivens TaxID=2759037 RepID=A0ABR7Q5T8_9FLAO|nr:hypothetical protein [Kordia aestuariivivens]MBC8753926.1 hypothetical protein [Kordia aestuariivivens]
MASEHKQTFYTRGTYCTQNNEIKMRTDIPEITLSESGNDYNLEFKDCYDISSENTPCILIVYSHGHPTDRNRLVAESSIWDENTRPLDSVFENTDFPQEKIFVITLHDEDFDEWHTDIYRFYTQHHVSFNADTKKYVYDLEILQHFIAGKSIHIQVNEEPKTAGGGVIDPINMS